MPDTTEDNIIDLQPYLEGLKFNWTVDMTYAVLQHGDARALEPKPKPLVLNVEEFLKS